jgi:hypothetical protein
VTTIACAEDNSYRVRIRLLHGVESRLHSPTPGAERPNHCGARCTELAAKSRPLSGAWSSGWHREAIRLRRFESAIAMLNGCENIGHEFELRKICRTVSTRRPESRLPGIVRAARRARAGWKCCTAMPPSQRATRASHDEVASPHHGKPPPPRILNTRNRCSPKSRAHERIRCWALANRAPASSHGSYFRMMCSPRECG